MLKELNKRVAAKVSESQSTETKAGRCKKKVLFIESVLPFNSVC